MAHPYHKHREHKASHARVKHILKADGGSVEPTVASPKFMMQYDKNSGGTKMKSDMDYAQRISDAVPRTTSKRKDD